MGWFATDAPGRRAKPGSRRLGRFAGLPVGMSGAPMSPRQRRADCRRRSATMCAA